MSSLEPYSDSEESPTDITENNIHVVPTLADDDDDDDDIQGLQHPPVSVERQYTEVEELPVTRIDDTIEEPTFINTFVEPLINLIISIIKMMILPFAKFFFAPTAQRTFIKTTALVVALAWILFTSIIAYILFYNRYVPPITHVQQVYFDHTPKAPTLDAIVNVRHDKKKAVPLRHEQSYDLLLRLHVPTSDINFEVGNFMVDIKLYTENGTMIMEQARPGILRYQSKTQRVMRVFAKALPLLLGFTEESQHLGITLIEDFTEKKSRAVKKVALSISDGRLQIYDSKLMVLANFKGLRYFMYFYSISTAFVFIFTFASIEFLFATIAWKAFGENLWYVFSRIIPEQPLQQQPGLFDESNGEKDALVDYEEIDQVERERLNDRPHGEVRH